MLSEGEIKEIIDTNKNNISLKDLVLDEGFKKHLYSKIEPLFRKHNVNPFNIVLLYEKKSKYAPAWTDGKVCVINAGDLYYQGMPVQEVYPDILGTLFHEAGHALYTNQCILHMNQLKLKTDIVSNENHLEAIHDILYKMNNDYTMSYQQEDGFYIEIKLTEFIVGLLDDLWNIVEDKRITNMLLSNDGEFTEFIDNIKYSKIRAKWYKKHDDEMLPLESEALETGNTNFETFTDFHYWITIYSDIDVKPDKRLYPLSCEALPIIDRMVEEEDQDEFFDLALELVAIAYPLFEDWILFKTEEEEEEYFQRQALKKQNN